MALIIRNVGETLEKWILDYMDDYIILHTIYRIFFPPQLVSPGIEPVKKNPTLCQKIYYCHPLA